MNKNLLSLSLLLFTACANTEGADPSNSGVDENELADDTGDENADDTGEPGIRFYATITDFTGAAVDSGEMCSPIDCQPVVAGYSDVLIPVNQDFVVSINSPGSTNSLYQLVATTEDLSFGPLVISTVEGTVAINRAFGLTMDPDKATLAQFVIAGEAIAPLLSTSNADGPFILDSYGMPLDATEVPLGGGFYIYLNVEPGEHTVTLPNCKEGYNFWGVPNDGELPISLLAGSSLGLWTVQCG